MLKENVHQLLRSIRKFKIVLISLLKDLVSFSSLLASLNLIDIESDDIKGLCRWDRP